MIRRPIPEPLRRLPPMPRPDELLAALRCATPPELESICRLFLTEGVPAAFTACPIEYENIRMTIAEGLGVHGGAVGLVGSGRIGYSLHPDRFAQGFAEDSKLDFYVVDAVVFDECMRDAERWRADVREGRRTPRTDKQQRIWDSTFAGLAAMREHGHFDPKHLFEHEDYERVAEVHVTIRRARRELTYLKKERTIALRIYRDWERFFHRQIFLLRLVSQRNPTTT
jgi:hypothetical protein